MSASLVATAPWDPSSLSHASQASITLMVSNQMTPRVSPVLMVSIASVLPILPEMFLKLSGITCPQTRLLVHAQKDTTASNM